MNEIKFSFFLFDVLFQLSKLSCTLQKKMLSLGEVHRSLEPTKAVKYKTRAGPKLKEIEDKTAFEGTELTGSDVSFANSCSKLLSDLISSLDRRLGDVSEGIVYATSIVDITTWPEKESSTDFGDDEIDCLVEHFTPVLQEASCDLSKIPDEWTALKAGVYSQPGWLQYIQTINWPDLNRKYAAEFPNLLMLVDLVLSLPESTAEFERGFNMMKQIKSDWRSTLGPEAINDLMTVLLLSPDIKDFDPQLAIDLWTTSGLRQRRPTYMDSSDEQSERGDEEDMVCVALSEIQTESDVHDITETQTEGNEGDIHDDTDEAINAAEP